MVQLLFGNEENGFCFYAGIGTDSLRNASVIVNCGQSYRENIAIPICPLFCQIERQYTQYIVNLAGLNIHFT